MPKFDLKRSLQNYVKANPSTRPLKDIERQTDEEFIAHMESLAQAKRKTDPSYQTVPKFFNAQALDKESNSIYNAIQREARSRFLQNKTAEILDKEDLEKLWEEIRSSSSPPDDGTERINYDAFLKVARSLPQKCRHFFSASTFLKFDRDEYGRIDSVSFFHSVVRKVSLYQTRIQISLFDRYGNGYLREADLVSFIGELLPTFPSLANMADSFKDKYMAIATKKYFFFLDPRQRGRVFIKDILTSPILAEQFDLRNDKTPDEFLSNWFSLQNAQRLVELFNKFDEDKDGRLNVPELSKFQWMLTDLFLSRAIEVLGKNGTIGFEEFIEFILIVENRKTLRAIPFLFKCLDVFDQGFIDSFCINMFFKEVLKKLSLRDPDAAKSFRAEDIRDEIFDMVNPKSPTGITLYDLYSCGQADIVLGLLVDAKALFDYDQRELGNTLSLDDDTCIDGVPGMGDKGREMMPSDSSLKNVLSELGDKPTKESAPVVASSFGGHGHKSGGEAIVGGRKYGRSSEV